jgi:hypothetical protein
MADDTYSRGYRNNRYDRGGAGDSGPATDPLTELARLIGQSDPFATDRKGPPNQRQAEADPAPADWRTGPAHHSQPYHPDQQALSDQQAYDQDPQGYHQDEQPYREEDQQGYPQDPSPCPQSEPPYPTPSSVAPEHGGHEDPGNQGALHPAQLGGPRRGWAVTAAALVGLAVVGTAGAFAYRAVFTGGATRIVTRDVGPSEIPPVQTSQNSANKTGDRLGSAGQNERMGPPPEQPIAIPWPPRTVPPALGQSQPPPAAPPALPTPNAANPPTDTPARSARVVRTETIKLTDQLGDAGATPAGPARAGASSPVQPPQPRVAPPSSNAPLSLASTRPAVERSGGGSGYYVQVCAEKSEEEAKSSFRAIQARHSALLGGQQPVIRRKDLGRRGIFYGAQAGPFSREAAVNLCQDLKAAGRSCMVHN